MSAEGEAAAAPSPLPSWPVLSLHERRVLGVLVEKSKTTPDVYPMSINALVAGCNQKSNRDPILDMSESDVEEALAGAKEKGLVIMVTGGRVVRWRQALYEVWRVSKAELAVLAALLLRGPQTEGELRANAGRMEPVADLDTLRSILRPLAERRLVVYLTPEGRRGTTLTHGFHAPEDLERIKAKHGSDAEAEAVPLSRTAVPPAFEAKLAEAQAEMVDLRNQVAELRATVTALSDQVRVIRESLGI
jgi:uncharacterized protein YceH (UPF0502 family)